MSLSRSKPSLYCDGVLTSGLANKSRLFSNGVEDSIETLVNFKTTKSGTITVTLKGISGKTVYFDWGDGSELDDYTLNGINSPVACTNVYSNGGQKTVKVSGDVDFITSFDFNSQNVSYFGNFDLCTLLLDFKAQSNSIDDMSSLSSISTLKLIYGGSNSISSIVFVASLSSLSNQNFFNNNITYTSLSLPAWNGATIRWDSMGLDSSEVDQALSDLADAGVTNCTINLAGTNGNRTAGSDADLATLIGNGNIVTVNP